MNPFGGGHGSGRALRARRVRSLPENRARGSGPAGAGADRFSCIPAWRPWSYAGSRRTGRRCVPRSGNPPTPGSGFLPLLRY